MTFLLILMLLMLVIIGNNIADNTKELRALREDLKRRDR